MRLIFGTLLVSLCSMVSFSQQNWGNDHPDLLTYWVYSDGNVGFAKNFKRLELGFQVNDRIQQEIEEYLRTGNGINPFDPNHIDISCTFTRPDGTSLIRYAFYFQDFTAVTQGNYDRPESYKNEYVSKKTDVPWRVRMAPDQPGDWKVAIQVKMKGSVTINQELGTFVVLPSEHKGFLKVVEEDGKKAPFLSYSASKEPFFAVGINLPNAGELGCYPSQINRWTRGIQELARYGGNFTRLEVGGQTGLPDWENPKNYLSKMDDLFAFDQVVEACEKNNVYAVLFRHHVEARIREDWAQVSWNKNPYNMQLKASPENYFKDNQVFELQKNSLRYFFSRYCYSPNIAFYGFSEIEAWYTLLEKDSKENRQTDGGNYSATESNVILNDWINKQQEFIRSSLNSNMLFLNTYASQNAVPKDPKGDANLLSDVVGLHIYSATKKANFESRFEGVEDAMKTYNRPVFIEESGLNDNFLLITCCTDIEFHNAIWSSAFMGTFSIGLDYWWANGIFDRNYHRGFSEVQRFFFGEKLNQLNFEPQKWSDSRNWKKRRAESFALVAADGSRALGWVHNSAIYWRNMVPSNLCLENLVQEKVENNPPCICANDPYGSTKDPYAPLRASVDLYKHENTKGYNYDKIPDNYSNQPKSEIEINDSQNNDELKLKGFKKSPWGKQKHWYKVVFYSTRTSGGDMEIVELTQWISSSSGGNLEIKLPNLTFARPDLAYKIDYLGQGISPEKAEIRTR